uniref:RRP15-like protein n=1 Tax=Eutreptiella gymnastica TaxID=73025 RepID=A0A7S1I7R4_9EUGL|mmetsp:Transcript_136040/g.235990  ORF Transcript_136040/g.235990 Transcript_136040/m.235990 type:complete len:180 (+) Transcript_136040:25-564(+)
MGAPEPREKVYRKKRKRSVEIVAADGQVEQVVGEEEGPEGETPEERRKRINNQRIIKKALKNQAHKALLPHLERPDVHVRLRRIATKGVVQLFNAVASLQKARTKEKEEEEMLKPKKSDKLAKGQETDNKAKTSNFLDMLRKGTASKLHKEQERREAAAKQEEVERERDGFAKKKKKRN